MHLVPSEARYDSTAAAAALSFKAPYVVDRLLKERVVDSLAEAEALFNEVKKYLLLSDVYRDVGVGMYSVLVDQGWHAFILYTAQYGQFCNEFFGKFIAHAPKNAPCAGEHSLVHRREVTFSEFRTMYEDFFIEPLPDVWYDVRSISPARRVINDWAGRLAVTHRGSVAELLDDTAEVVVSANEIASEALEFIARTGAFHVRELPGGVSDNEKVALVRALMSAGTLRLAP